jgi:hypothetical protein
MLQGEEFWSKYWGCVLNGFAKVLVVVRGRSVPYVLADCVRSPVQCVGLFVVLEVCDFICHIKIS